jgi:hypothetical protein
MTTNTSRTTRGIYRGGAPVPRLLALVLTLGTLLGLGVTAAPAEAATGTTTVKVCATNKPSYAVTPALDAYWWNGSDWVLQSSVRATCATFTLGHNGYWHFMATTVVPAGCVYYQYQGASKAFTKQSLPSSSAMNVPLQYIGTLNYC